MSAQGGTLQRRGTIELPIWPVAALVAAAIAAAVGMALLGDAGRTRFVTSVTDSERLASSTAAIREQGASLPVLVGISHVTPLPATVGYVGFENPAAYATTSWDSVGGPNEALHRRFSPSQEGVAPRTGPIIVNGQACMQCR